MQILETEYDQINDTLIRFIEQPISKERQQQMVDSYGAELAAKVQWLYNDVMDAPVDWSTATMDAALVTLHAYLTTMYPWLTSEAKTRLNYCFIMCWK